VAIRLNMWHWLDYTGNQEWFDVPCANFYGWSIVLCLCSALLWQVRPLTTRPGWRGPLAALGALALALTRMVGLTFPRGRQLHFEESGLRRLLIFHKYEWSLKIRTEE